ncbi:MAG: hypothetical protein QXS98_03610 [Candidatus Nitrosocaldus sp.]
MKDANISISIFIVVLLLTLTPLSYGGHSGIHGVTKTKWFTAT